jgi:hypothetical protein
MATCCHAVWSANGHPRDMIISTRATAGWTMLPADEGTTHGTWRIERTQFFTTASIGSPDPAQYTVILTTKTDFVIADQSGVFYETRLN